MMQIVRIGLVLLCTALLEGGCADTATCDPGQKLKSGMCFDVGTSSSSGEEADGGGIPECGPDAAPDGEFGRTCTADSECGCPAPVCAIQPGDAEGFCTQIGCDKDPTLCPAGFTCFDLSVIDPSYPVACLPES